jgi:hypothetical protein
VRISPSTARDSPLMNLAHGVIVIHVILSLEAGKSEIPVILQGRKPPPSGIENLGTQNYSRKPAAVVLGGGYDDNDVAELRDACNGEFNVPWLRPDLSKATPPLGPAYGKAMVERVKSCLKTLAEDGKPEQDGIVLF